MASERPNSHTMVVGSDSSAVGSLYSELLPQLKANGFSEESIFAVHLALEEAFTNAVRHGNKMDATREVKIAYWVGKDKVEVSVTDEGEGFDPESVPDPRFGDNLYKPEGRGLFLMRSYMDKVMFNERGNSVRMVKYQGRPNSTESDNESQA
jgi:serine/threonine-protein kinase RsbW